MRHAERNRRGRDPRPQVARARAAPAQVYEIDLLEGLEPFVLDEVHERFGDALEVRPPGRAGAIQVAYAGAPHALLTLRSALAVYRVDRFQVPRPKALLGHQHFSRLIALIDAVRAAWPAGAFATLRISAAGEDTPVMLRLKDELARASGLTLAEEGDLLLRLRRAGADWEVLTRISPRPLATRPWRVCNLPGALNATLAHVMMRLTRPQPADRLLNLACGSATLLIERLALGRTRLAIGCDIDPAALACARENLIAAGYERDVRLELWDAGELPVEAASFDVLCADLPFGQLVGSHRVNEELYPRVLAEAARVARPGARMVLITHEVRLLERVAAAYAAQWQRTEVVRVRSGGMTPRVFLFERL